ncbi:hypothetical protein HYY70_04125 [Candidatus Woesearchaeota archaeon]|nr:hypothetical protein [Candidatus Woesearchaeota archaeon]
MIIRIKRKILEQGIFGILMISIIVSILIGVSFTTNYVIGATNVTNNTVLAIVNVTNTEPNITLVVIYDETNALYGDIDLIASGPTIVTCNVSIFDYNGAGDIDNESINATLHIQSVGREGNTDNNHRYRNSSCGTCAQFTSTNVTCECKFGLQYYANDSNSWVCNVTVRDRGGTGLTASRLNFSDTEISSTITVAKLLAINTSTLLDYGNLSVTQTSAEIVHNITNVGNINLNLSLRSYGGDNESLGQNVTMVCGLGNITFGNQRYEVGGQKSGIAFADMRNVTNQTVIINFTFPARIDDTTYGLDRNSTLWRLQVPLSVGGICNGTIIFGAIDAEVV